MAQRSGIYLPGDKSPREWIICKACGKRALVRVGGKGYCSKGCSSRHRTGTDHPLWRGDDASYYTLHRRVYAARGKADHCERCGVSGTERTRYHWANLTGHYEDIWDYEQMCVPCHAAYDASVRAHGTRVQCAKLTEDLVREARRRHTAGESATSMADEFGVSRVALANAIRGKTWKHVPMECAYRQPPPGRQPKTVR